MKGSAREGETTGGDDSRAHARAGATSVTSEGRPPTGVGAESVATALGSRRGRTGSWGRGITGLAGAALLAGMFGGGEARGEIIELLDRTKMNARIVHFYDGVFTVEVAGQTQKVPREKIRSIGFQLPPARPELSTPEKTFDRWRRALTDGDMDRVVDCYALMYQGLLASQMGQASDAMKKMQKEVDGTKFQIKGSAAKGETATLKVERKKGDDTDTGEVAFVRENGEWKMLPPQQ